MSSLTDEQRERMARNRELALQRKSMSSQSQPIAQAHHAPLAYTPQARRTPPPYTLGGVATRGGQPAPFDTQPPTVQKSRDEWDRYQQQAQRMPYQQPQPQPQPQTQYYYPQQSTYVSHAGSSQVATYEPVVPLVARARVSDSMETAVFVSGSPDPAYHPKRKDRGYDDGYYTLDRSAKAPRSEEGEGEEAWYHCGNKYLMQRDRCKKCHKPREECLSGEGSSHTPIVLDVTPARPHPPGPTRKFAPPAPTSRASKLLVHSTGAAAGFFAPKGRQHEAAQPSSSSSSSSSLSSQPGRVLPWKAAPSAPPGEIQLSAEQQQVLQIALGGDSIFFTGNVSASIFLDRVC
jgi:hypothetical protein